MKSPNELLQELKELVTNLEKDAEKATRGMKAAGIRFRSSMQQVRDLAIAARKSVLEFRTNSPKTETKTIETVFENLEEIDLIDNVEEESVTVEVAAQDVLEEPTQESKNSSYWYSDFSY